MSNEEQAPGEPGRDPGPHGPDGPDEPALVDPDEVVLDDGGVRAGTLEPELSVSPDTLDLAEPDLAPAQISRDVAEAASLEDAAREARAVAAAAEEAGTLVGGPMPASAPIVHAAPEGTAPAGGPAGDTGTEGGSVEVAGIGADLPPRAARPVGGPGTDPAVGGARPRTPLEPVPGPDGDAATTGRVPTASGSATPAGAHPSSDRTPPTGSGGLPLLLVIGGVLVLLGLLGLLVWLLISLFGGPDDEGRVDPSSLAAGGCLAGFTGITEDAEPVDCTEPHKAQLVASESYPDDAGFPGRDQLGLRAEAACAADSAGIDPDVVLGDLRVTLLRATPTEGTWAAGDRRVDCFAVVEGDAMDESLLDS